LLSKLKDKNW